MSGFAGFFAFPDPLPDAAPLLARLGRALSSPPRPADAGPLDTLTFADNRAGLTGPRLERSGDGALALAFDGTILNRTELTAALETPPLRAMGDGELVLALYARHGAACVERLRGPFAFALWDGRAGTCLLARDPMGLRALYYFQEKPGGTLLFATGVRPLAASGIVPRQLDARGLYGLFRHGAVPEPSSMVAGVRALEASGRLFCRDGNVTRDRVRAPWRFAALRSDAGLEEGKEAAKTLRAALLDSVDRHLSDSAPTAVFLGGGMGSAALLALARAAGREKNLRALTLGFDDARFDETTSARHAASEFGVPFTHLRLDRTRARAWFDDFLPALDQPGVHGFPLFALCRFTREEGLNTALAGIGAGELFGKTSLHWTLARMRRISEMIGRGRAPFSRALGFVARSAFRQRWADFLSRSPAPAGAYAALRGIHTAAEARALVARFTDPTGCADPTPEDADTGFPTLDDEINALELRRLLRDRLLRDADAISRAHGLELRLPFVDASVMETLTQIPAALRLRGEHWSLLREAVPEAASWENAAGSSGLCFPAKTWHAAEWGMAKPADAAGVRRSRRTWEQKWSLFLFRRWWRQINTT